MSDNAGQLDRPNLGRNRTVNAILNLSRRGAIGTLPALLVALIAFAVSALSPATAAAETICVPGAADTYTQTSGDPATAPPGSLILPDGESCPAPAPVDDDPAELPPPPVCEPCPDPKPPTPDPDPTPDPPGGGVLGNGAGGTSGGTTTGSDLGGSSPIAATYLTSSVATSPLPSTGFSATDVGLIALAMLGFAALMRAGARHTLGRRY